MIDDAHSLDQETVNLLDLAVGELVQQGVLIALALRPDEPTEARRSVMSLTARVGPRARRLPLGGLGAADVAVLAVLALLGRGADIGLLERIVGADADSVLDGCEAAVLVGLLVDDAASGGFALSHDLVRQSLEDGLSPARRIRLHARVDAPDHRSG